MEQYPSIRVGANSSARFRNDVVEALEKINEGPSGRRLLQQIEGLSTREKVVTIVEAGANVAPVATARLTPRQQNKLGEHPWQHEHDSAIMKYAGGSSRFKTRGTASEIPWNKHTAEPNLSRQGVPTEGTNPDEAFITLAHELVHAKHHLAGTMKGDGTLTRDASCASTPSGKEELRAVGLGKYANSGEPSENSIRREHGLPKRETYSLSGNW
ncbi:type III secretion system effector protein [Acidovorax sp. NCPPB 2350]|nr:type III secretion system effector protein [Acidovorax sp. NCPPB 2350]